MTYRSTAPPAARSLARARPAPAPRAVAFCARLLRAAATVPASSARRQDGIRRAAACVGARAQPPRARQAASAAARHSSAAGQPVVLQPISACSRLPACCASAAAGQRRSAALKLPRRRMWIGGRAFSSTLLGRLAGLDQAGQLVAGGRSGWRARAAGGPAPGPRRAGGPSALDVRRLAECRGMDEVVETERGAVADHRGDVLQGHRPRRALARRRREVEVELGELAHA